MKCFVVLFLPLCGALAAASAQHDGQDAQIAVADLTQEIQARAIRQVEQQASQRRTRGLESTCTKEKLYFRKE